MSYTTLYTINPDGTLTEWTRYRNAHGVAPMIWSICSHKYCVNVASPDEGFSPSKRHYMLDDSVLKELCQKANAGGLSETDRRVVWTTYDRACVRIEDVQLYAHALRDFAAEHGPAWKAGGRVFHIDTMADDLDRIYTEREEHGWRGVAWNQTSVADTWHSQEPTDEQRRSAIVARIRAIVPSLDTAHVGNLADLCAELIHDTVDGGDRVEDNVDVFGCTWLPGADQVTLTE